MKVRFDGLDVTAMVAHLQRTVLGQRVVNVYDDHDGNTYLLKLENKQFLLLESGVRFHTTIARNTNAAMPSPFCAKLRKHLRGLRLEHVAQLGRGDRVALFQFGVAQQKCAIVLELYAKGNLILVDGNSYKIQALLRSHVYQTNTTTTAATADENENQQVQVQVGHVYPVTFATSRAATDDADHGGVLAMTESECNEWIRAQVEARKEWQTTTQKSKKKKKNALTLKTLLLQPASGVSHYGPALLEHCILVAQLDPHCNPDDILGNEKTNAHWCETLLKSLREEGPRVMAALQDASSNQKPGYILYQPNENNNNNTTSSNENNNSDNSKKKDLPPHSDKILQEFQPHLLQQHANRAYLEYADFGAAVDDFFTHVVSQKSALKAQAAEAAARQKLERVRVDQADRLTALHDEQDVLRKQAVAVQQHADNVEKALAVVNSALDSGMDWDQLEEVVAVEQQKQNPIALLIHRLDLEENAMILRLTVEDEEEFDVKVSLKDSAHANANELFAKYRASKEKAQKTIESSSKALKAAEETAKRQLEEAQKRAKHTTTLVKRKPAWFERFLWFITSDNYLVLAGRDAHQNELLVKRYLRPGDAYLHADVHGAASCILRAKRRRLKNGKTQTVPLSDRALQEAGNFTVCRSSAWSKKMVMSAWWVESHQVSKTAPTGEYLTVGSFMVRGKKNFLPPCQLEMGLAVLFRLGDDDSVARHQKDRRDFALLELENAIEDEEDEVLEPVEAEKMSFKREVSSKKPLANAPASSEKESCSEEAGDENPAEDSCEKDELAENDIEVESTQIEDSKLDVVGNGRSEVSPQKQKKRGLSVRDRKLIKKYGSLEEAQRVIAERESKQPDANDLDSVATSTKSEVSGNEKAKRGKKAKMKRAMKKYGDQDDEDRELAMLALQGGEKARKINGSKRGQDEPTEVQTQVAAETVALLVKDASIEAEKLPAEVRSVLAECVTVALPGDDGSKVRWDKFDAGTLEQLQSLSPEAQEAAAKRLWNLKQTTRVDNFSASLGGIIRTVHKYGHMNLNHESEDPADGMKRKTKEEKNAETQKWKQTMAEEGIVDTAGDDDAVDDTIELNKLTGKPHSDDMILFAIPVCAPYSTLSQYTYRIKLTPGNLKRGKAAKQCVDLFVRDDNNKATANHGRYKEYMKKVIDNDWMQTICADVKISAGGTSKATKKSKAANKKSKNKKK